MRFQDYFTIKSYFTVNIFIVSLFINLVLPFDSKTKFYWCNFSVSISLYVSNLFL